MTGLDAVAQWLLGGGGEVLRFVLYVLVAWVLIGALPRMRRDAARKVPQVRGVARDRMREHTQAGRGRPAEWWGWTAAWAALATAGAAAGFGRYMITSAWHGWGDHRRRAKALRERRPWRRPAVTASEGDDPGPPDGPPWPPPPDWDPLPPYHPGGPSQETGPSREPGPDRPSGPSQPGDPATAPSQPPANPVPAYPGAGGNGDGNAVPMCPPGFSPAGQENEGALMAESEIRNLEAALRVVSQMQDDARRALDKAQAEKMRAEKALRSTEQASQDLASAGVSGPVMEAFVRYHEAMEMAERSAASVVVAYEMAVQAADSARGALQAHQDAAERLAATGGAADSTQWYGG